MKKREWQPGLGAYSKGVESTQSDHSLEAPESAPGMRNPSLAGCGTSAFCRSLLGFLPGWLLPKERSEPGADEF
jgi:hypothetical protein